MQRNSQKEHRECQRLYRSGTPGRHTVESGLGDGENLDESSPARRGRPAGQWIGPTRKQSTLVPLPPPGTAGRSGPARRVGPGVERCTRRGLTPGRPSRRVMPGRPPARIQRHGCFKRSVPRRTRSCSSRWVTADQARSSWRGPERSADGARWRGSASPGPWRPARTRASGVVPVRRSADGCATEAARGSPTVPGSADRSTR